VTAIGNLLLVVGQLEANLHYWYFPILLHLHPSMLLGMNLAKLLLYLVAVHILTYSYSKAKHYSLHSIVAVVVAELATGELRHRSLSAMLQYLKKKSPTDPHMVAKADFVAVAVEELDSKTFSK
jgi:hypothetical protein